MTINLPEPNKYRDALDKAWGELEERSPDDLISLGAKPAEGTVGPWQLRVLDAHFIVDSDKRSVTLSGDTTPLSTFWQILALHYLLSKVPVPSPTGKIAFEDMPDARVYSSVYKGRVVGRFLWTAGRTKESFKKAATALGGHPTDGGTLAFGFDVFPLARLEIIWYAGDEDFPPGASFLYDNNIVSILDVEDIVVMAERVVSRLGGKPW